MKNRRHRLWITLNTGAALLLALVVTLMVNYLSFRHYYREDWSRTQLYKLSSKTIGLLESLDKPVEVTVFFQPGNVLYEDIHNLLREYQFRSSRLNIQWVDPDRDISQTEELAVKYQVKEPNVVVFDCDGRSKYVRADEIANIDKSSGIDRITSFKGELAFSSAIQGVVQKTIPVVYVLTGHGERDITDFDRRTGFSGAAQLIERDNISVKPLLLSTEKQIPADCSALLIAGASQSMSGAEADLISVWLHRSGRLMVLADTGQTSGLEKLLREWGVLLRNDVVIDPDRTLTGREVFVSAYNRHPITAKLGTTAAIFHLPRSVQPDYALLKNASADRPKVTPLALSSKNSWAEAQPDQVPAKYDAGTGDMPGPVSLAVAVEKGDTAGVLDMKIRPSRLVVFGDSGFVSNSGLTGGDTSLFMSSLNWLLDREQLMAITPKDVDDTRLKLSREKVRTLFWSTIGIIPALAALVGTALWFRRRK
ncbi:MAG: GldG family protein [Kiritimatiellaceae bacterium]|nr:GldG family protein [Kiritimatiellaceae bacterium]